MAKSNKCAVFIWTKTSKTKKETCHLVCLSKDQQKKVLDFISTFIHGGKIQAFEKEYDLQYIEKNKKVQS